MKFIRIKNWDEHFETYESRKIKNLNWVAMPLKHDGRSFRRIMARDDGPEVFSCFILLLQVAARMPSRGMLVDRDGILSTEDLFFKTGMSEAAFDNACDVLSSDKIGWIELADSEDKQYQALMENLLPHAGETGSSPASSWETGSTGQDRTGQNMTEQNPTQQNQIPASPGGGSQKECSLEQWRRSFIRVTSVAKDMGINEHDSEKRERLMETLSPRERQVLRLIGWKTFKDTPMASNADLKFSFKDAYMACSLPEEVPAKTTNS